MHSCREQVHPHGDATHTAKLSYLQLISKRVHRPVGQTQVRKLVLPTKLHAVSGSVCHVIQRSTVPHILHLCYPGLVSSEQQPSQPSAADSTAFHSGVIIDDAASEGSRLLQEIMGESDADVLPDDTSINQTDSDTATGFERMDVDAIIASVDAAAGPRAHVSTPKRQKTRQPIRHSASSTQPNSKRSSRSRSPKRQNPPTALSGALVAAEIREQKLLRSGNCTMIRPLQAKRGKRTPGEL